MRMLKRITLFSLFSVLFLVGCSHHRSRYLGYIQGDYVYLSSPVSGTLTQLAVEKGQAVAVNQLAFQLDPQPELSQLQNAEANLVYTKKMLSRNQDLHKTNAVSESVLDLSRQQYESAIQQVSQYRWMVDQKTVHFSQNGFVQDTLFRQNEFVPAGKPVIALLPSKNITVVFFIPEQKLSDITLGQKIYFTCDGCQKKIVATINYISSRAEYTPPVIYSQESRDKLVYWVEAEMDPTVAVMMHPGQPVEVVV